ncbi:MAG: glycosyltransferase family 4 protein [Alphaproteobacteria bacterium]|nr:glycosyltransferase family 4 protein [Alphaproteobacteria bacterium]
MRPLALFVPAPLDAISGGYLYDRRIIAGLHGLGHQVSAHELAGRHPLPDLAAEAAAKHALDSVPPGTAPVIDGLGLPAFLPMLEALRARDATALIHHPTALETGLDRDALRAIELAMLPAMPRIIATSRLTAAQLAEDFSVDPARITVVEPGTDPAPRARGSQGACHIISVGALVPRKGHDVLLRALARLTDLEWRLTIVGAARDRVHADGLSALAEELGIAQRVTCAGELEGTALEAAYDSADLFALATHWEGYGMAAAEALARGLPCAITAGGAIADVVPKPACVMAPPGDHNSLSRAMRRPIYDPALRAEMAAAAWEAGQYLPRWEDRAALFAKALS